ncbi:MAG: transglycosylase SLT domain-containing protein [Thermodesulfovibrionales bacterium]
MESGRYEEAIKNFSIAGNEFSILADYALFFTAEAYHKIGNHGKAVYTIRAFLEKYPLSPLREKARVSEIREATENGEKDLLTLYKTFIKDYPDDDEMNLEYGLFLKQSGGQAMPVLKQLYIKAGPLSKKAYSELDPADINTADLIERASNLINRYDFEEAEHDLRKARSMDNGLNRQEILKKLGYCLFSLKRYKESAAIYEMIHDAYYMAYSFYRAGETDRFNAALKTLSKENDKRVGSLLLAVSADKRRRKDYGNAIKTYAEVLGKYPADAENAAWGIGWTHYISGDFKSAEEVFSKLHTTYNDPKYLYWQARSLETRGGDASRLYETLAGMKSNFYSILASARISKLIIQPIFPAGNLPAIPPANTAYPAFERIEALISLSMIKEAGTELMYASTKNDSLPEMTYIISRLQDIGEFKRAIGLAGKIPYTEKYHRFWYPLAYWDTVENVSKKNGVDPLLTLSVIREESRFDADAKSEAGALGLMQLIPPTAYKLGRKLNLGITRPSQISDVRNNIQLGTYYIKGLFSEFNSLAQVIAAYNAGERAVRKWKRKGQYRSFDEFIEDIPYVETRNYVKRVIRSYYQYKKFSVPVEGKTDLLHMLEGK